MRLRNPKFLLWLNSDDNRKTVDTINALGKSCLTPTETFHTEMCIRVLGEFTNCSKTANGRMSGIVFLSITP